MSADEQRPRTSFRDLFKKPEGSAPTGGAVIPLGVRTTSSKYGIAALEDEARKVATAAAGGRNDTLNRAVFAMAQLIAAGHLDTELVHTTLRSAGRAAGLDEREIDATLASGYRAGSVLPRDVPELAPIPEPRVLTLAPTETAAAEGNEIAGVAPSWTPVDLGPYLDGTWSPPEPTLLERTDGICLLYPGLVHDFHGESESGKSLLAQGLAAQQLAAGLAVLYVDFESDAGQVAARLLALGATREQLREHLVYVRPEASPYALVEQPAWVELLSQPFALVVLDGVTDALGQFGAASKDNDDIATWHRLVPRTLAVRTGAAVLLVDHVVKSTEGRGRFAIGGQTKMAAIDGASYLVEVEAPLGKGLAGVVVLRVGKDRPGTIRPHCGTWRALDRTQEAARVTVDSTGSDGLIRMHVEPPTTKVGEPEDDKPFRPTGVMEKVSRLLELRHEPISARELLRTYKGDGGKARDSIVYDAVNLLVAESYLVEQTGPRNARMLRSAAVYRQHADPSAEGYRPPATVLSEPDERPLPTASRPLPGSSPTAARPGAPLRSRGPRREAVVESGREARPLPDPASLFAPTDPTTGLRYDPRTGEVID